MRPPNPEGVAMNDEFEKRLADLDGRVEALNRTRIHLNDRVDELEDENKAPRARVAELEELVDPDPGAAEYEQSRARRRSTAFAATSSRWPSASPSWSAPASVTPFASTWRWPSRLQWTSSGRPPSRRLPESPSPSVGTRADGAGEGGVLTKSRFFVFSIRFDP